MKHPLCAFFPRWLCHMAVWCLCSVASSTTAVAQEAIYRCGQEYTNAPRGTTLCERLSPQAVTVITGTRPVASSPAAATSVRAGSTLEGAGAGDSRTKVEAVRPASAPPNERDVQARTIVSLELDKARQQLAQLVQEYNQGEPEKWAGEVRNHAKYLDRVAALKAAIERTERDIVSLQRELSRRPPVLAGSP